VYGWVLALAVITGTRSVSFAGAFEATEKSIPEVLKMFEHADLHAKEKFRTVRTFTQNEKVMVEIGLNDGRVLSYSCVEYMNGSEENIYCNKTSISAMSTNF
jgi:hypothetical protein